MGVALLRFAVHMQEELNKNSYKSGWHGLSPRWIINRIRQETDELERAIKKDVPISEVISECADVANFAMMLSDNLEWEREREEEALAKARE